MSLQYAVGQKIKKTVTQGDVVSPRSRANPFAWLVE